jgi:hypothetical protein
MYLLLLLSKFVFTPAGSTMQKLTEGRVSDSTYNGSGRVESLTVPIRMHLSCNRLSPAFNSEFARVVVRMTWEGTNTCQRRDVEDQAAAMVLLLSHNLDSLHRYACRTKEQSFNLIVRLPLRRRFGVA